MMNTNRNSPFWGNLVIGKCLETQVALLYVCIYIYIYTPNCVYPNALTTRLFKQVIQRFSKTWQNDLNTPHSATPPHPDIAVEANSTGSKDPGAKNAINMYFWLLKRNPDLGQRGHLSTSWHASTVASPSLTSSMQRDPNYLSNTGSTGSPFAISV